ncbi:hypothetical protein ACFPU0_17525 [Pseudomonas sp. GCM10022186]|uniref:hypothetical protein n=1 Tax=Pseudomonas sp. GCM10022186 TaxID=3252650 RepID=UPI0036104573
MSYRSIFLAVLSLVLGGCAVYDYDDDYYGRGYHDGYRVDRYYDDPPRKHYYIVDHRYDKHRYYDRRKYDGRKDYYYDKPYKRYDKHYYDHDRKYRHDRRYYQPRYDNFQERRHDYSPRLRTWGKNNVQPDNRQYYRVQPGYEARPHNNHRYNNRSDWSQQYRR